ncbi:oligosaccharide flippase family protein [Geobacillus sp. DSP4a]|uniref:oligosaccharide flippase family protein n=1 Tax=Geobacillus sp. DSP4a TaxID=2508873 RepID=UPI001490AE29|nr:oligosaccharide flippase family protein [Geobacillus sp. DSP4a]NNU98273.1 hypothetical protein [Geobacillus sp. DSP4a]
MIIKEDVKRIITNTTLLSSLQIFNYIIPLFLFPYLTHTLGTTIFGIWMLSLNIIQYLNILIDYGFNLSATKKVAIWKRNKEKIAELFTSVMFIKFLFFTTAFCIVVLFSEIINNLFRLPNNLLLEMFLYLFGLILTPFWLFQGLEQLKIPTLLNLVARIFSMFASFICIKNANDIYLLPIINGIPLVITGCISWVILYKQEIKLIIPKWKLIKKEIVDGFDLFISSISVSLYTILNSILLGIFAGPQYVAYYSICEKIIQVTKSIITPVFQATYPFMAKTLNEKRKINWGVLKILFLLSLLIGSIIILILNIFNDTILNYFLHGEFNNSVKATLLLMSFIPLISFLNNSLFIQTLVPLGESKYLRKATFLAGFINILFVSLFAGTLKELGSSMGYVLSELSVLILGIIKVYMYSKRECDR